MPLKKKQEDGMTDEEFADSQSEVPIWMVAAVPDKIIDWVEGMCSPKKTNDRVVEPPRRAGSGVTPGTIGGEAV
eukprot:CAMPEP_0196731450 /NCGR_PEP_ID=MMETSP1091-20130531/11180_1 /TAXON_ID=302021 /ORGANISM="Rhodomonas sp., Strain CCMP768" /LENGTH=73 /DNA_ID=CAMNT_0042074587 /DNA_START=9 /DNA_END=230 /DNA_ORIENTATION=+